MRLLGREARGAGRIYLVGGASAVIFGWRDTTIDVDLKLDPEPPGVFEAMAHAKDALNMNLELASPDDFIPALPDWRERSVLVARHGSVDFLHYDFYAQALAKIERGHARDLGDVEAMARLKLIESGRMMGLFEAIEADLVRFPAIDPCHFRRAVESGRTDRNRQRMTATNRPASDRGAIPHDLPGADLVAKGIDDLSCGELTVEALLVAVGTPRLRNVGLDIPHLPVGPESPELQLYAAICAREADNAHSRYNALIRRLVSFERAMEMLHPAS